MMMKQKTKRFMDLNNFAVIFWVATLSVDRIDFLNNTGYFRLTPYLIITIYIIIKLVFQKKILGTLGSRLMRNYSIDILLVNFLIFSLSVVFSSYILLSIKRYLLFAILSIGSLIVVKHIIINTDRNIIFVKGAKLAIWIFTFYNILSLLSLIVGENLIKLPEYLNFSPTVWGNFAIRLTGSGIDANRSAFALAIYMYILFLFNKGKDNWLYFLLGVFQIIATLSKTGTLAALILFLSHFYFVKQDRKYIISIKNVFITIGIFIILIYSIQVLSDKHIGTYKFDILRTINDRISMESGSANLHFKLFEIGFNFATIQVKRFLIGEGYGTSSELLSEIFSTRYGNFHSLYLTLMIELGIISTIYFMLVIIKPLFLKNKTKPLILAILSFGIFYQNNVDPIFWFSLSIAYYLSTIRQDGNYL